jgi:4-hydroxybenzoate polyprenyltransferase
MLTKLANLIRTARPQDWIKNVFVLIPLPFAVKAGTGAELDPRVIALGFFGFCLVASSVYVLNDVCDAKADRLHPQKRFRPVAAGLVSPVEALLESAVLLAGGVALSLAAGKPDVMALVALYVGINVAYSLGAKHAALADVFLLCAGFLIRVFAGCALVGVAPSPWLQLCTASLALFLGFGKRRADLAACVDSNHRRSLVGYTETFLGHAMAITAGVTLLSYAVYAIEGGVFLAGRQMASLPFVAYGILNYLRLAWQQNGCGSPVEVAYASRTMQLCAVGWVAAVFWSLGIW